MSEDNNYLAQLVQLMQAQNKATESGMADLAKKIDQHREEHGQKLEALRTEHGQKLETLALEAVKDSRAYTVTTLFNIQAWVALRKEAIVQINKRTKKWLSSSDSSFIILAIFLAIVTGFTVQAIQSLLPSSSTSTSPAILQPPMQSALFLLSLLFYILSLMCGASVFPMQMVNGLMGMLANQWAGALATTPKSGSPIEQTLAVVRQSVQAESLLFSQGGYLVGFLSLSIGFFLVGFVLQVFSTGLYGSQKQREILFVAGTLLAIMCFVIVVFILWTTRHALAHEDSPFQGPLSGELGRTWKLLVSVVQPSWRTREQKEERVPDWEPRFQVQEMDKAASIRWYQYEVTMETLKVYGLLVTNASETELLDKVVPSFSFIPWCIAGAPAFPIFKAIHERFSGTGASLRVQATLTPQAEHFWDWITKQKRKEKSDDDFLWLCMPQFKELYLYSPSTSSFRSTALLTYFRQFNNELKWSDEPQAAFTNCVIEIVTSYDPTMRSSTQFEIFEEAVRQCGSFAEAGYFSDDDRISLLKEFFRASPGWNLIASSVSTMVKGMSAQTLLDYMTGFLSDLSGVDTPAILGFLVELSIPDPSLPSLPSLPPYFSVPYNLDLSSLFSLALRNPILPASQSALLYYLGRGVFDKLSNITSPLLFFSNPSNLKAPFEGRAVTSEVRQRANEYIKRLRDSFAPLSNMEKPAIDQLLYKLTYYTPMQDRLSEDKKGFLQAVNHCNYLLLTNTLDGFDRIPQKDHLDILASFLKSNLLDWFSIKPFFSYVSQQTSTDLSGLIVQILPLAPALKEVNGDLSILDIFAALKEKDISLPLGSALTSLYDLVTRQKPKRWNWRKYSDFLMDCVPLDQPFDSQPARHFYELCTHKREDELRDYRGETSDELRDDRGETSDKTRQRATKYLGILDEREERQAALALAPVPSAPAAPTVNPPSPHPASHFHVLSSLNNILKAGWNTIHKIFARPATNEKILNADSGSAA
ncbi:hypothetical protein SISNIDRAFT_470054 [Sistotremastrum niveocremeum HHB9708]|uniref:DUF6535 domain-containing protein n=1 Tax=Sistotremastrum niveocremeum HHB9708 TaxID=1314777 RepID=A0A164PD30_9AGAM|nr:hypothetical protein SISNIDRAFT_470054 [Sistotremastrum niveocremeum HHB9708]